PLVALIGRPGPIGEVGGGHRHSHRGFGLRSCGKRRSRYQGEAEPTTKAPRCMQTHSNLPSEETPPIDSGRNRRSLGNATPVPTAALHKKFSQRRNATSCKE